jgi:hypothetical protein
MVVKFTIPPTTSKRKEELRMGAIVLNHQTNEEGMWISLNHQSIDRGLINISRIV